MAMYNPYLRELRRKFGGHNNQNGKKSNSPPSNPCRNQACPSFHTSATSPCSRRCKLVLLEQAEKQQKNSSRFRQHVKARARRTTSSRLNKKTMSAIRKTRKHKNGDCSDANASLAATSMVTSKSSSSVESFAMQREEEHRRKKKRRNMLMYAQTQRQQRQQQLRRNRSVEQTFQLFTRLPREIIDSALCFLDVEDLVPLQYVCPRLTNSVQAVVVSRVPESIHFAQVLSKFVREE